MQESGEHMNPSEFLDLMGSGDDKIKTSIRFGTVDAAHVSGKPKIVFDGMDAAGPKLYPYLSSYRPFANDRVMIVQGVVIGKIDNSGASPWIAPTLLNSWVNYDPSYWSPAGYMKDSSGIVHLRGLVKSGTVGSWIFVLPSGFRPARAAMFSVIDGNNAICRCDVHPDGAVVPATMTGNGYYSLDGITFLAEQ
jgi:hypothetical protein